MAETRHIIIDGQILQGGAWHRGMGKYTLQLVHELDLLKGQDTTISLIFNTSIETEAARLETIKYLCPGVQQLQLELPIAKNNQHKAKTYREKLTNYLEENFPSGNKYFIASSLFTLDYFAEFPTNCRKLLLMYDLTPFMFWRDLGGYFPPDLYMKRFEQIYDADTIHTISETVRQDVLKIFGIDKNKVVNINGGFTKVKSSPFKPDNFNVPEHYILFPTADLPHKNNRLAVQGFDDFNRANQGKYKLLVSSTFSDRTRAELGEISDSVVFTGNVTDEELHWLYVHADAVLFASKYEGLGIPILDAVANDKPVIASRIPVFEEMSKTAYYYFEPDDVHALEQALGDGLTKKDFDTKKQKYPVIVAKYTWEKTGKALMDSLDARAQPISAPPGDSRYKIALACVNPGIEGQLGRLAEAWHGELSSRFLVDYYFDSCGLMIKEMQRPSFLDYIGESYDVSQLTRYKYTSYDVVVYLIDQTSLRARVAEYAAVLPGLVITTNERLEASPDIDLMLEIITKNQIGTHKIKPQVETHEVSAEVAEYIMGQLQRPASHPTAERAKLIRSKLPNRSIMKRLIERLNHD